MKGPSRRHLWLELPAPWRRAAFAAHLADLAVHAAVSDAFAVGVAPPEAVRLCLGGDTTRDETQRALGLIADALHRQAPEAALP